MDWIKERINNLAILSEHGKNEVLTVILFNKQIRNFIHAFNKAIDTLYPIVLIGKISKNVREQEMVYQIDDIYKAIIFLEKQIERVKKLFMDLYMFSNNSYTVESFGQYHTSEIYEYLEHYKARLDKYIDNEGKQRDIFLVYDEENILKASFFNSLHKIKEVIDIVISNAVEELIEKEDTLGKFEKIIKVELFDEEELIYIFIYDNGWGI